MQSPQQATRATTAPLLAGKAGFPIGNSANEKQAVEGRTLRVAVYARYSTDGQKETSIEDQIRTCLEAVERFGLAVSEPMVFADDAVTGSKKGTHKREQYHALRDAIRAGKVDLLVCDQQCRLARHARESLDFLDDLRAHQVRLLTADGFDSEHPTASLLFGIKSVFSEFFLDETRHRVRRGMKGGFARGDMVTAIPYGYQMDVQKTAATGQCTWQILPDEAAIVQEIFRCRKDGLSFNQIAAILNGRRVPTSRRESKGKPLYWRASGIWRILQNPIYKGVYQVNFSGEKPEDRCLEQRLVTELALVSPEDWGACQTKRAAGLSGVAAGAPGSTRRRAPRGSYGGGKHALAGVLRCGVCDVPLSCHHAKADGGSMHCIQCEHATAAGIPGRQPQYVSIKGVRLMLRWLLEKVVAGEAVVRYRECLRERLAGGQTAELAEIRLAHEKATRSRLRLSRLLGQISEDDPMLEQEYLKVREEVLRLEQKVHELESGLRELNPDAIQKQLDIDLADVLDAFLSDANAPERTRALLNRVFPSVVLKGKTDRYTAIFRVEVKPGAILAEASETTELADGREVIWVRLQTSGSKNPVWTADEIQPM